MENRMREASYEASRIAYYAFGKFEQHSLRRIPFCVEIDFKKPRAAFCEFMPGILVNFPPLENIGGIVVVYGILSSEYAYDRFIRKRF